MLTNSDSEYQEAQRVRNQQAAQAASASAPGSGHSAMGSGRKPVEAVVRSSSQNKQKRSVVFSENEEGGGGKTKKGGETDDHAEGGFSSAAEKTHGVLPEDQKKLTAMGISY